MSQQKAAASGFKKFHASWLEHLRQLVEQLRAALGHPATQERVVRKVMSHYAEFYAAKSVGTEVDVLGIWAAPWTTTMERSLHWIGGWRPTTVFHLIYTESSIRFESHIVDILRGVRTGDLGDLSPSQFRRVSELQCETVNEENAITGELAEWQDGASELVLSSADPNEKIERLVRIVHKADNLRLQTLRKVVDLLSPQQAVEFLVAAVELQLGFRAWGMYHDNQVGNP